MWGFSLFGCKHKVDKMTKYLIKASSMFLHGNFCSATHLAGATTVPSHQRHGCLISGAVFGGLQRNEL